MATNITLARNETIEVRKIDCTKRWHMVEIGIDGQTVRQWFDDPEVRGGSGYPSYWMWLDGEPAEEPTPAQRERIIRWAYGPNGDSEFEGSPNAAPLAWATRGLSYEDITQIAGRDQIYFAEPGMWPAEDVQ